MEILIGLAVLAGLGWLYLRRKKEVEPVEEAPPPTVEEQAIAALERPPMPPLTEEEERLRRPAYIWHEEGRYWEHITYPEPVVTDHEVVVPPVVVEPPVAPSPDPASTYALTLTEPVAPLPVVAPSPAIAQAAAQAEVAAQAVAAAQAAPPSPVYVPATRAELIARGAIPEEAVAMARAEPYGEDMTMGQAEDAARKIRAETGVSMTEAYRQVRIIQAQGGLTTLAKLSIARGLPQFKNLRGVALTKALREAGFIT